MTTTLERAPARQPSRDAGSLSPAVTGIEIGVLTKGKPTLSMALISLLLQEVRNIRIHIVDTSDRPVINRDDVVFALRLAFDREIPCDYEFCTERDRAFSVGRLKLLEALRGPHICFMDDDVVMASSTLALMSPLAEANPDYGFIIPTCRNAGVPGNAFDESIHYVPGGLIRQDETVRAILLHYYESTVDVLDRERAVNKVWETVFLTQLFEQLDRPRVVQPENVVYHLDYLSRPNWELTERRLMTASAAKARELIDQARLGSLPRRPAGMTHLAPPRLAAARQAPTAVRSAWNQLRGRLHM